MLRQEGLCPAYAPVVRTRTRCISLIRALLRQQGYRVPSGSVLPLQRRKTNAAKVRLAPREEMDLRGGGRTDARLDMITSRARRLRDIVSRKASRARSIPNAGAKIARKFIPKFRPSGAKGSPCLPHGTTRHRARLARPRRTPAARGRDGDRIPLAQTRRRRVNSPIEKMR